MKSINKVKEIFVTAGWNYSANNRSRNHKTLAELLESGIVKFDVCSPGRVWVGSDNFRYNVMVEIKGIDKKIFRRKVDSSTIDAFDVLRFVGKVLQREDVKAVIKSYVDIDSACKRCGGEGYIRAFSYYCNGICFGCFGLGYDHKHIDQVKIVN